MVVSFSVFEPSESGHGGRKRTNQIRELLSAFDHHHIVPPFTYTNKQNTSLKTKVRRSNYIPVVLASSGIASNWLHVTKLLEESNNAFVQDRQIAAHDEILSKTSTVVWENNFPDFFYFPQLLKKKYRAKVIACPQNIEALVPEQKLSWHGKTKTDFLSQEIEAFKHCDAVFTISEEEQWLLNLLDIPANFLPYYPMGALYEKLVEMRSLRSKGTEDNYFLIVGSVGNPPTKAGLHLLLQQLKRMNVERKHRFKVGGFGTEIFASEFGVSDGIEILGALEEVQLNKLMINCKAMIVSQGYSTGALTKIPEILVAGIPVIVNTGASRTYKRMDGVYIYESFSELVDYLTSSFVMPAIPAPPHADLKRFIQAIS